MVGAPSVGEGPAPALDVERVRRDFPILAREVHGRPLVYLDNAASAQKPAVVIEALASAYRSTYANVHRGLHFLSERATAAYEAARSTVAKSLGGDVDEVVFVRGTTEAINLVAQSFARPRLQAGDEILISGMEHHSNIVPWQLVAEATGARLMVAPIDDRGRLDVEEFDSRLGERTRIVALTHVSNALGTVNPVRELVSLAHARGVPVLVDGAQAMPHLQVDVRRLGCDFYAFSGHKVFGPAGIGALWGRRELLEAMPPYQGGGEMITSVSFERSEFRSPPGRFEAGTPNFVGAVGLAAALDYLADLGHRAVEVHERSLLDYATARLEEVVGLRLIGTADDKVGVLSFVLDGIHPHDAGTVLDREGIAVRAGHHCAQPVMDRFGVPATLRASLAFYNTRTEVDHLLDGLGKVREILGA